MFRSDDSDLERVSNLLEADKEELELVEWGYTNKVYRTPEGSYVKLFSDDLADKLARSLGYQRIPRPEERARREILGGELLPEVGFQTPDIEKLDGRILHLSPVKGESYDEVIEQDADIAAETGSTMGSYLREMRDRRWLKEDANAENFLVDYSSKNVTIGSIDNESFRESAAVEEIDRMAAIIIENIRGSENNGVFEEEFRESYGKPVRTYPPCLDIIADFYTQLKY